MYLLVLIILGSIWMGFKRLWRSLEIQDGGSKMAAVRD